MVAVFDGTARIVVPDSPSLRSPTTAITMAAWFRYTNVEVGGFSNLVAKLFGLDGPYVSYGLTTDDPFVDVGIRLMDSDLEQYYNWSGTFSRHQWYFAVGRMTVASGEMQLNVWHADGTSVFSNTFIYSGTGIPYTDGPLFIGYDTTDTGSEFFAGEIAGVYVHSSSLSTVQVSSLFTATRELIFEDGPGSPPITPSVGYWPLHTDASDASGNGNHGTAEGVRFVTNRPRIIANTQVTSGAGSVNAAATLDVPAGTQEGDLLIAYIRLHNGTQDIDWVAADPGWTAFGSLRNSVAWVRIATDSEPASYTFQKADPLNDPNAKLAGFMVTVRDHDPDVPVTLERANNLTGTSSIAPTPGATPVSIQDLEIRIPGMSVPHEFTESNWTERDSFDKNDQAYAPTTGTGLHGVSIGLFWRRLISDRLTTQFNFTTDHTSTVRGGATFNIASKHDTHAAMDIAVPQIRADFTGHLEFDATLDIVLPQIGASFEAGQAIPVTMDIVLPAVRANFTTQMLPPRRWRFFPPVENRPPMALEPEILQRYSWPRGISVIRDGDTFVTTEYVVPHRDWIEGRDYFVGGYHYSRITEDVAEALIAAGFEPVEGERSWH